MRTNSSVKWDAPPYGGFENQVFYQGFGLRLTSVSGTPLTVTLDIRHETWIIR
jgi:hypothetical protein